MKWVIGISLFLLIVFRVSGQDQPDETAQLLLELKEAESNNDMITASRLANKLAFHFWSESNLSEAAIYFEKALRFNETLGNKNGVASLNNYLGLIYSDQADHDRAISHLSKALEIRRELNDAKGVYSEMVNLAVAYRQKADYKRAVELSEQALEAAKELNDITLIRRCYGMLTENYSSLNDPEKSLEYFELFTALDKEIQKQEQQKLEEQARRQVNAAETKTLAALAEKELKEKELQHTELELDEAIRISKEREMQIELLNKENQIKELRVREQESRLRNEKLLRNSILTGLTLALIIAVILFTAFRQKQKANVLLARQNKEISEQKRRIEAQQMKIAEAYVEIRDQNTKINRSIIYAQRIQNAVLSHWDSIYDHIPDSFVFYKPRDIVSGDVFYYREIKNASPKHVIAAIDCTGHGVPGAFMSMIAFELLHEIIDLKKIYSPDKILSELHFGVRMALKQSESNNRDGMDISLVVYDPATKLLEYAGARNPVIYIQNNTLYEIRGDRQSIGGIPNTDHKTFTRKTLTIDQPTTFYLYTDGFQDQFGGEEGDKLLSVNFKNLLYDVHSLPWKEQHKMLETQLRRWQGKEFQQIDDILVIGFRLGT